jgi:hypothetical protein
MLCDGDYNAHGRGWRKDHETSVNHTSAVSPGDWPHA